MFKIIPAVPAILYFDHDCSYQNCVVLPEHVGWFPVHSPLSLHILVAEPFNLNPSAQVNAFRLPYTTPPPLILPFLGAGKEEHSTTEVENSGKQTQSIR